VRTRRSLADAGAKAGTRLAAYFQMSVSEERDHELERLLFEVRRARLRLAELLRHTREQRAAFESTKRKFRNVSTLIPKPPKGEGQGDGH
jgi:hypothetical protein